MNGKLRRERDVVASQLSALDAALTAFMDVYTKPTRKRCRKLSDAARRKISLAQKARWAKVKGRKVISIASRRISPAGRARIAAAARARWAKFRAKQKS